MKLPLSWLSDYTDMNGITPKEYDAKLTMSGSKVEEVYYLGSVSRCTTKGSCSTRISCRAAQHCTHGAR